MRRLTVGRAPWVEHCSGGAFVLQRRALKSTRVWAAGCRRPWVSLQKLEGGAELFGHDEQGVQ